MRVPLKLNAIDQEHLQELYNASGIARDELPYTEAYEALWTGFQDRTFKNAARDQLFGALLKYTRSSTNSSTAMEPIAIDDDQKKLLKGLLPRFASGGKILPYSDEFEILRKEFNSHAKLDLNEHDFWRAIIGLQGGKRRPPVKRPAKVAVEKDADDDEDGE